MTQFLPPQNSELPLDVLALNDHTWCVCDRAPEPRAPRRVVGYIEQQDLIFDVLALAPATRHCGYFNTWDDALQALMATNSASAA